MSDGRKLYTKRSVLDAFNERMSRLAAEFDNIVVAFSGGKDSGLLLNLSADHLRQDGRRLAVMHQDFEAQYSATTEYVERTLARADIDPYWLCLPMRCKTATSMFEQYWEPWAPEQQEIWVRPMPTHPGVMNIDNAPDFYRRGMLQEDVYAAFTPWFHEHVCAGIGRTVCLVGIRADESLNRWRAISEGKNTYRGLPWTTQLAPNVYSAYPIYDWGVEDVWGANAKFGYDYNRLYDLFYQAGLSVHEMRVASPFNDWAIGSLKLYRVIEPNVWGRMVGRVNGANFCAIYGGTKAVAWKNAQLPKGHTWRSYVEFLLKTLPEETRQTYEEKFATSIEFWRKTGGVLSVETIDELRSLGIRVDLNGQSNYKSAKQRALIQDYPDDADVKEFQSVPSYKRMAICILKNDHLCKYMGFSQTQTEMTRRRAALAKYADL